jgi:hypothetical protein
MADYEEDVRATVGYYWSQIRSWRKTGRPIVDAYNIRMKGLDLNSIANTLDEIFRDQESVFKVCLT